MHNPVSAESSFNNVALSADGARPSPGIDPSETFLDALSDAAISFDSILAL